MWDRPEESRSLLAKKRRPAWRRLGALAVVGGIGVVPLATRRRVHAPTGSAELSSRRTGRSEFCIAHAAYGEEYKTIAAVSAVTKRRYAELHGYRFLQYLSSSLEEFVTKYCPELEGQIELAYSKTTPVKSCGIWAALRDSCDYVLWTDADAVVVDSSLSMESLLFMEKSEETSAEDVARLADKDVLFFLEDFEELGLCPELSEEVAPAGFCGSADAFGNCVNTGALIVRSGRFAETLIRDQLALAVFDNDFLLHSPCSTNDLGVGLARNITWDQCMFAGETEQCTLSCLYRNKPELLDRTMCRISDDNATHYLYGILLDPPDEAADSVARLAAKGHDVPLPTTVFEDGLKPPHPYSGSLVFNCMGGNFQEKLHCVTYATYNMWPELQAQVDAEAVDSRNATSPPPSNATAALPEVGPRLR